MPETQITTRRRVVVDQRELAKAIGARIRAARQAAGLTQQELAGDRYTKAYISALELGHAKPSMAALDYLAPRLGTTPDRIVADHASRWTRVDADLSLAAGRFREAAEAYADLAGRALDPLIRGELLVGAGEAYAKLQLPAEAGAALAEADALLAHGGRPADRVRCTYWLGWVHQSFGDAAEARRLLDGLLADPVLLAAEPDMEVRIRLALAATEVEHGSPERAVLYLEEARAKVDDLDLRKRAVFYDMMARARYESGDIEAAIAAGREAQTLYRSAELELEVGLIDNWLAMSLVKLGNLTRADELVGTSIATLERLGHSRALGHSYATRATIRLDQGDPAGALEAADLALAIERDGGDVNEQLGARVERARALGQLGRREEADAQWAEVVAIARALESPTRRKKVLTAFADDLAAQGRHAEAYEAMKLAI